MEYPEVKEKLDTYFASLNATSRRLVNDIAAIRGETNDWENLSPPEQAEAIWKRLVTPSHEELYSLYPQARSDIEYYPILRISSGEKIVIDEDGSNGHGKTFGFSWRDEHSAPFSWETQSQLDMCIEALQNLPASEDQNGSKNDKLGQGCLRRKKKAPTAPTLLPRSTSMMKAQPPPVPPPAAPASKTQVLPAQENPETRKDEKKPPISKEPPVAPPRKEAVGSLERSRKDGIGSLERSRKEGIGSLERSRKEGIGSLERSRKEGIGSLERSRKEGIGSLERRKALGQSDIKRPAVEPPKPPVIKSSSSAKETLSETSEAPFKVDLHSPSQAIPKTGFDFLDNW